VPFEGQKDEILNLTLLPPENVTIGT